MGNQPGSETIGDLYEISNQELIRPQIKPFVPDDKNADFQGYEGQGDGIGGSSL